jgi:cell division protein ZapA
MMASVTLTLNGVSYPIACGEGEENRVRDLGAYVDGILRDLGRSGAAKNETHSLVLACLILTDQLWNERDKPKANEADQERLRCQEDVTRQAIEHLTKRLEKLADKVKSS